MKLIGTLTRRGLSTANFSSDGYDPHWGCVGIRDVRTVAVERWLKQLCRVDGERLADATKAKIRNLMSVLFNHAIRLDELWPGQPRVCARIPPRLAGVIRKLSTTPSKPGRVPTFRDFEKWKPEYSARNAVQVVHQTHRLADMGTPIEAGVAEKPEHILRKPTVATCVARAG